MSGSVAIVVKTPTRNILLSYDMGIKAEDIICNAMQRCPPNTFAWIDVEVQTSPPAEVFYQGTSVQVQKWGRYQAELESTLRKAFREHILRTSNPEHLQ